MMFWQMVYNANLITIEQLRLVVKTETNPYGEITPEQFEQITNEPFVV